jgi:zinc/manganese transport system substrate-binding protein
MKNFFLIILISLLPTLAHATEKPKVVASFSIIGDMTREVAGDNIELKTLVGANGDAHEYEPTPTDVKAIASADLLLINGLKFEGWVERLIKSANYKGKVIVVSNGGKLIENDPHAWQDLNNGRIYVDNIKNALVEIDKSNAEKYQKNAAAYNTKLTELDSWVKSEISKIPSEKRNVITTHDAFQYFAKAYGINFISALGISTSSQASAKDIAKLVGQIRNKKVTALFLENISDSRLIKQLEKDTGAHIGGTLYSDSLSANDEPATSYIEMFKHNAQELVKAMEEKHEK